MKNLNLSSEKIEAINDDHIHAIDKLYRMHAGISSRLVSVKQGVALIEVDTNSKWPKSNEVTASQFIESWNNHNPDLMEVDGWEVRIYINKKIAGFTISVNEIDSPELQEKINQINGNPEKNLVHIYRAYNDNINHPIISLKDLSERFKLEFTAQFERVQCEFFDLKDPLNYIIENRNVSGNLFIIPHNENDYLLIVESENDEKPEVKHVKASKTPVTYSFHSNVLYLINISKEQGALLFWQEYLTHIVDFETVVESRNCHE